MFGEKEIEKITPDVNPDDLGRTQKSLIAQQKGIAKDLLAELKEINKIKDPKASTPKLKALELKSKNSERVFQLINESHGILSADTQAKILLANKNKKPDNPKNINNNNNTGTPILNILGDNDV